VIWQYKNVETGKVVVIETVEGHNKFFENKNPHDWVMISVAKNKEGN
jgi:hypothetical protein